MSLWNERLLRIENGAICSRHNEWKRCDDKKKIHLTFFCFNSKQQIMQRHFQTSFATDSR